MEDIEKLFDKAVGEIERLLNTKAVVGEPITVEGNTLIPLVNVGFGFGVGGGQGSEPQKGSGHGGGTAPVLEKVAETIGSVASSSKEKLSD